ncbi:MAG: hypothetical protein ACRDLK_01455 [Gaiellaceae bacterium]
MRRLVATLAALSLFATAGIAGAGGVPPFPHLAGAWSHAEINIKIKRTPHTLILDRGRIRSLTTTQLTLREADGTLAPIQLSARTIVTVKHVKHATIFMLRRGLNVETMSIDGGAAIRVRVTS